LVLLNKGEKVIGFEDFIHVKINQFYGIEINDFAVTVAKTALWIAESQMMAETEKILGMNLNFLPLTTNAFIVEGNALRMDWATLQPYDTNKGACPLAEMNEPNLFSGFTTQTDGKAHHYDYIIGNPPFVGFTFMTTEQKKDMQSIFQNVKNLDFVCAWYKKSSDLIQGTDTKCAFVSTNSICQGETVARFWNFMKGIKINFAYRSFIWDSESNQKAHVHCVIVGFSCADYNNVETRHGTSLHSKRIFNADGTIIYAQNINAYLLDCDNVLIDSRNKPICNVPDMVYFHKPADGGNLIIEAEDYDDFIAKEPKSIKYIHPLLGAVEYLHNKKRYCLWLEGISPTELKSMPLVYERIKKCKEIREESIAAGIRKFAETPHLFAQRTQPIDKDFIILPRVSSETREYVPISFLEQGIIVSDAVQIIPNATLYHFGILTSSVHMAWMRAVCGRLEMRYRYSKDIVYNNFVWPSKEVKISSSSKEVKILSSQKDSDVKNIASKEAKISSSCNDCNVKNVASMEDNDVKNFASIERTAQAILDARALYPDSSLADLYDLVLMPVELRRAHQKNDEAVLAAYGWPKDLKEQEIVARLFALYEEMVKEK